MGQGLTGVLPGAPSSPLLGNVLNSQHPSDSNLHGKSALQGALQSQPQPISHGPVNDRSLSSSASQLLSTNMPMASSFLPARSSNLPAVDPPFPAAASPSPLTDAFSAFASLSNVLTPQQLQEFMQTLQLHGKSDMQSQVKTHPSGMVHTHQGRVTAVFTQQDVTINAQPANFCNILLHLGCKACLMCLVNLKP